MDDKLLKIRLHIENSIYTKRKIEKSVNIQKKILHVSRLIIDTYKRGGKVFFCGNGGSAADAQHLSAELTGRFEIDRKPLYSEALHVNTSYLTAVANDYSFDEVFSRLVEAKCSSGDVLISISTSGNSINVLNAIEKANSLGVATVGLTGKDGGKMASLCGSVIQIPSNKTSIIQESHIMVGHIICGLVEESLFLPLDEK